MEPIGFAAAFQTDVTVTDRFEYKGVGGRISSKRTAIRQGAETWAWRSTYAYDDQGSLVSLGYPECLNYGCADRSPARTLTFGQDKGLTTSISGIANTIHYQSGGMLHEVQFTNGVTWRQLINSADGLSRPHVISSDGATTPWTTNAHAYDGAGNVTSIGDRIYEYDSYNRLVRGAQERCRAPAGDLRQRRQSDQPVHGRQHPEHPHVEEYESTH